jgi:hypothetical protein
MSPLPSRFPQTGSPGPSPRSPPKSPYSRFSPYTRPLLSANFSAPPGSFIHLTPAAFPAPASQPCEPGPMPLSPPTFPPDGSKYNKQPPSPRDEHPPKCDDGIRPGPVPASGVCPVHSVSLPPGPHRLNSSTPTALHQSNLRSFQRTSSRPFSIKDGTLIRRTCYPEYR